MHPERGPVDRTFVRLTNVLSASLSLGEPPVSGDATVARDEVFAGGLAFREDRLDERFARAQGMTPARRTLIDEARSVHSAGNASSDTGSVVGGWVRVG